jgi:hypothetical protein
MYSGHDTHGTFWVSADLNELTSQPGPKRMMLFGPKRRPEMSATKLLMNVIRGDCSSYMIIA